MLISEILKATKGKLLSGDEGRDIDLCLISTDSRTIKSGEFFLPLKGDNFDGEAFVDDALKKGAIGAFVQRTSGPIGPEGRRHCSDRIIIEVKDTLQALHDIARRHRRKFNIPVIGVTGSNGKTTVKEMVAKVLSSRFNVLKNEGTKNNHIGVPQTLLKLNSSHAICVLEMGTNHRGEIRILCDIAKPTVAVITNIGPSHLEYFKDLKGVFNAKKEIFESLNRDSLAVLNGDDRYLSRVTGTAFRIRRFGFNDNNDFKASRFSVENNMIKFYVNDRSPFILKLLGIHNVHNALAAIAVGEFFHLDYEIIKKELAEYSPPSMRLNISDIGGLSVIDDAYNSNPLSMKCALETIKEYPAPARWVVSADMLELGGKEKEFHRSMGEVIANMSFEGLITFGNLSRHTSSAALERGMLKNRVWHCDSHEEIAILLRRIAKSGDVVLIKGSRAMKMEEVIKKLRAE